MELRIVKMIALVALWMGTTAGLRAQTVVEYIHTDALGTPVAVTNAAGTVIERSVYEPYGQLINRPLIDGPGFTGHVQDAATGLAYMQQRYYDPVVGRFLSVDPIAANPNTGASFNRYIYGSNNPYRFTDPDGRQSRDIEYIYKTSGATPPPRSDKDWLGPVIGYTLGGMLAAPVAGLAVANPATAAAVGNGLADIAMGDALGGASIAAGGTVLYRVVDDAELASILKLGTFSASPNGDGVKRFLGNLPDAKALQKKFTDFFGDNQHIVEGVAPKSVMESATRTPFSDVPGRAMESVNIPSGQVQKVMCTGSHIKKTSC